MDLKRHGKATHLLLIMNQLVSKTSFNSKAIFGLKFRILSFDLCRL